MKGGVAPFLIACERFILEEEIINHQPEAVRQEGQSIR